MILIGLGANLPHPTHGPPAATLQAALALLERRGVRVLARSRLYLSAAVGPRPHLPFVNAAAVVETALSPQALLGLLHEVETALGRRRRRRWGARIIDLDLIDYHGRRLNWGRGQGAGGKTRRPILPHPEAHRRAFVLRPLLDLAPGWRHPVLRHGAARLLRSKAVYGRVLAVRPWRPPSRLAAFL